MIYVIELLAKLNFIIKNFSYVINITKKYGITFFKYM